MDPKKWSIHMVWKQKNGSFTRRLCSVDSQPKQGCSLGACLGLALGDELGISLGEGRDDALGLGPGRHMLGDEFRD